MPWDWPRLRAVALRQTRRFLDPDLAEDAAQEAVLRAWRSARSCAGDDPIPWITTIARREALRIAARPQPEPLAEEADEIAADNGEQEQRAAERIDLQAALARLSPAEQEAVLLHYWADMTNDQIATALDSPIGTVKIRIYRARSKLGAALATPPVRC